MSRRNQSRRRRSYGRRQHEVRERRPEENAADGWLSDRAADFEADWQSAEAFEDHSRYGDSFASYGR